MSSIETQDSLPALEEKPIDPQALKDTVPDVTEVTEAKKKKPVYIPAIRRGLQQSARLRVEQIINSD